jgi:hypothetical protein
MNQPITANCVAGQADARSHTLSCGYITIPAVSLDGQLWLAATPLATALGFPIDRRRRASRYLGDVGSNERDRKYLQTKSGLQPCTVITLPAALRLADGREAKVGKELAQTLRSQAAAIGFEVCQ